MNYILIRGKKETDHDAHKLMEHFSQAFVFYMWKVKGINNNTQLITSQQLNLQVSFLVSTYLILKRLSLLESV